MLLIVADSNAIFEMLSSSSVLMVSVVRPSFVVHSAPYAVFVILTQLHLYSFNSQFPGCLFFLLHALHVAC